MSASGLTSGVRHWTRRSGPYLLVAWVAITLNFLLPRLAPGDPLEYLIGPEAEALSTEQRSEVLEEFGLDRPLAAQYGRYLTGIVRGDLGTSLRYGRPVTQVLLARLPWTLLLVFPALVISIILATMLGVWAAARRGTAVDGGLVITTLLIDSLPAFWIGMVLIAVFSVHLGWFPSFGAVPLVPPDGALENVGAIAHRLVLPLATLVVASLGHTFLLARGSVLTTLGEDYVTTAHAVGVPERRVLLAHVLPNALLPVFTSAALGLGGLFGGAVLVETVFGYPGVGRVVFDAVSARDYPLLQGAFLLIALGVVAANWFADLTYPLLDPRVRGADAGASATPRPAPAPGPPRDP